MQIIYVIGGVSPEYLGWLQVNSLATDSYKHSNSDVIRRCVKTHVDRYMLPAGQKYHLYWASINKLPLNVIYQNLEAAKVPRYGKSKWFNTDVWTIRRILSDRKKSRFNYRHLTTIDLAKYLNAKYQKEMLMLLRQPRNFKERRFKRDFFNTWGLSSIDSDQIAKVVRIFSAYLLLRNLVGTVPSGCRKMFRKLVPLRIDVLDYDLKLLDYKSRLGRIIKFKDQINSLRDKPFGTAEFTNQYLKRHVKFLQIFDKSFLKKYFNL